MSAPRKILVLDTGNEWGGGTNSLFELLKRIDRARFAPTCCFYNDYRQGAQGRLLSEELAALDVPLILLPTARQPWSAKLAKELSRVLLFWAPAWRRRRVRAIDTRWRIRPRGAALAEVLRAGGFDLLYMNNQPSTNLEGYLAAQAVGVPVVQHCRVNPRLAADETRLVNGVVSRIICVSQATADALQRDGVDRRLLTVVHNGIDARSPLPAAVALQPPPSGPVIGTVGRLTPLKSVAHLLQAVAALHDSAQPVTCLIIGEGPQRNELQRLADELRIAGQVRFVGFQSPALAWLQACDVCVLCSVHEGLPRVVLEAMLAGKPVVASAVAGSSELVVDGETGILYRYGDIAALTDALRRLLQAPPLRHSLGEAGRRRVIAHFSIDTYVDAVSQVLSESCR